METSDNSQQFKSLEWLSSLPKSELDILFEEATKELCTKPWFSRILPNDVFPVLSNRSLYNLSGDWEQLLPFPEPRPQRTYSGRFSQQEAKWLEEERIWRQKANNWLTKKENEIGYKIYKTKEFIRKGVPLLNSEYNINLNEDKLIKSWFKSIESLTLNEFLDLIISNKNIGVFLAQEATQLRQSIIPNLPAINVNEFHCGLTLKQVALLKAFRGQVISRDERANDTAQLYGHGSGDKLYQYFTKVNTPIQRTGVKRGSIDNMIKDIEAIIPFLNESQLKQAENETHTLQQKK